MSRSLGDCDLTEQLRLLLLTSHVKSTSVLLAPKLLVARNEGSNGLNFQQLATVDLALDQREALMLDAQTDLLVWRGAACFDQG